MTAADLLHVRGRVRGASVVEAVVALLLGLFLLHLGYVTMGVVRDARRAMDLRLDLLTATRIAQTVLRRETDRGLPGRDWMATDDSVRLRAFRGTGVVCGIDGAAGQALVAYRGDRLPAPSKDSVELLSGTGAVGYGRLESARPSPGSCAFSDPDEVELQLTVRGGLTDDVVLVRLFESGSYHLHGSALRYRTGGGGRQPLTPEVWLDRSTRFLLSDSTVGVRLTPLLAGRRPSSSFLSWRTP